MNITSDMSFPVKGSEFEKIQRGEVRDLEREWNLFWKMRVNKACQEKFGCDFENLNLNGESLLEDNGEFYIKFFRTKKGQKESLCALCSLKVVSVPKSEDNKVWWDPVDSTLKVSILREVKNG